ncbi:E3 ISG15--protein ligase herc5 [Balamuthia mandrillaris]
MNRGTNRCPAAAAAEEEDGYAKELQEAFAKGLSLGETEDGLQLLPVEIWHLILSSLQGRQVRKAAQVCRTWKDLLQTREKRKTLLIWGSLDGNKPYLEAYSPPRHASSEQGPSTVQLWTIPLLKEVDIVQISSGWGCALLLDSQGRVWKLGPDASNNNEPAVVKELCHERVVYVATSEFHSLAVTCKGEVYSWGTGGIQLGRTTAEYPAAQPAVIPALRGHRVVQVAVGIYHSVALTEEGKVFAWGGGSQGCPGQGSLDNCPVPTVVLFEETAPQPRIVQIASGGFHVLALADSGKLYSWGWAYHGALGYDHPSSSMTPKHVQNVDGVAISRIETGRHQTFIISETGKVLTFGCNVHGRLGLGHETSVTKPHSIPTFADIPLAHIASNEFHTLFLTGSGHVYSCGSEDEEYKRLGLDGTTKSTPTPMPVKALAHENIVQVSCGRNFSLALADEIGCATDNLQNATLRFEKRIARMKSLEQNQ